MKLLPLAISACLAATPVVAQQRGTAPHLDLHAVNPTMSLSAPTNNPLQEQMRQDYATQLMGAQSELLQQNPSGLGRPAAGDWPGAQRLHAAVAANSLTRLPAKAAGVDHSTRQLAGTACQPVLHCLT
jgi:hypothetical protein